jgi:ADP-heptose:LPS heptosyltransferase
MNLFEKLVKSERIVIVRTDRIGDMVLTLPLARALKELNSEFKIFMIANSYTEFLLNNEYVDEYYYVDKYPRGINGIFRDIKFDAAFFPMPKFEEIFAAFKAGIPLRIGSAYRFYSFLFNHRINQHRKESKFHEAEYNVKMLSSITGNSHQVLPVPLKINENIIKSISNFSNSLRNSKEQKIIVFHPGSRGSAKDLPISIIYKIIQGIALNSNYLICLTGVENEKSVCDYLANASEKVVNLCGKFTLEELTAFLMNVNLFISNSTGVLHIASSIGTPVIGFYPNTPHISSKRWGPLWTKSIIISPPQTVDTFNDNMNEIKTEDVISAIEKILETYIS